MLENDSVDFSAAVNVVGRRRPRCFLNLDRCVQDVILLLADLCGSFEHFERLFSFEMSTH